MTWHDTQSNILSDILSKASLKKMASPVKGMPFKNIPWDNNYMSMVKVKDNFKVLKTSVSACWSGSRLLLGPREPKITGCPLIQINKKKPGDVPGYLRFSGTEDRLNKHYQWCTILALSWFQFRFWFQAYSESPIPIPGLLWKPDSDSDSKLPLKAWFRFQQKVPITGPKSLIPIPIAGLWQMSDSDSDSSQKWNHSGIDSDS